MDAQQDLFSTHEQRPEDDPFVREIVRRFGGRITAIVAAKTGAPFWIETQRPLAGRRRYAPRPSGEGHPVAVHCDFRVNVRNRSQAKKGINIGVWQMVWSESREPLGVGLFESEAAADLWRKSR